VTVSAEHFETFDLNLQLHLRYCRAEDVPKLEWGGMFSMDAYIIEKSFLRHLAGKNIMLVCEANNFPIAQVWIDLERHAADGAGFIWALRVLPGLRRLGIGTRLVAAAEALIAEHGFACAEISVETHNVRARQLYERLGYQQIGDDGDPPVEWSPEPEHLQPPHIIMRKQLTPGAECRIENVTGVQTH